MLTHAGYTSTHAPAHTAAPLLRYLQATPVVRDHAGRMFSATDHVLTQPASVLVQYPGQHPGERHGDAIFRPGRPVRLVLNLLFAPREQRLSTPPRMPIDHPGVVVIVDHGNSRRVIERGAATVQAVQAFLNGRLRLPTTHLPAEMIREPYFDGEQFDVVYYSEIITAMVETGHSQHQAVSSGPLSEADARWDIQYRLLLAVYCVDAEQLITPGAVADLPYC